MKEIGLAHSKGITASSGEQYIAMSQRGMGLVAGIHAELLHASTARTMGIDAYPLVMAQRQSGVGSPTCADVVLDDLEVLLPDVHDVPLDEIISFRAQHGAEFRAYMAGVRAHVVELSQTPLPLRAGVARSRAQDRADAARELSRVTSLAWTGFTIAVSTSAVTLGLTAASGGSLTPPLIALAGAVAGAAVSSLTPTLPTRFAYLLRASREHFYCGRS